MAECEEEVDVLVQRVVKDISNAFKRNPNIDEIGVIPCPEARCNRSPIVLVENKLGVESWCVKFLLPYVHNKLLLYRQRKHWLDREALVDVTSTLLLLNPDFTTAWNVRKELLQCGALTPEKDLYLGKLALTKFPKSPETWIHRRWVLQQVLQSPPPPDEQLTRRLQEEMKVCCDAACRYPSNYNAWSHRIWVLQRLARGSTKVSGGGEACCGGRVSAVPSLQLLHDELSSTRPWVSSHVSDHSGFHYRQFLLRELMAAPPQAPPTPTEANGELAEPASATLLQLFHQELELCSDLIQNFPGHETLWSHRRHVFYLWHLWRRQLPQGCSCNGAAEPAPPPPPPLAPQQHAGEAMELEGAALPDPRDSKRLKRGARPPDPPSLASECSFVSGVLDGCCNREQKRFAAAYRKWIHSVIGQQR